jgi:hypothetical protein
MTVHLHTPASPRVASCGDATATRFTPWRWKATCNLCKLATAARQMDGTREEQIVYRTDLPVRFSALVALVRANGLPNADVAIAEFERDRKTAAHCVTHGELADPIALLDAGNNRMVFVCPECASRTNPGLRRQWEVT